LSDIKNGRKKGVSTDTAQKIADYFGVTVGYLLGTEEQKNPDDVKVTGREAKILEAFNAKTPEEQKAFLTLLGIDLD
jgi:transcriptional regulator with XRE-family HTH domain